MKKNVTTIFIMSILLLAYPHFTQTNESKAADHAQEEKTINRILDDFHQAAAEADGTRYFNYMAEGSRFLGTDAKERWSKKAFQDFAYPYFSKGQGWTYIPKDRCITFSKDGNVCWFDERLINEKYGELRGSGVLEKRGSTWKIMQYNMAFTVPNDVASKVVALIRKQK